MLKFKRRNLYKSCVTHSTGLWPSAECKIRRCGHGSQAMPNYYNCNHYTHTHSLSTTPSTRLSGYDLSTLLSTLLLNYFLSWNLGILTWYVIGVTTNCLVLLLVVVTYLTQIVKKSLGYSVFGIGSSFTTDLSVAPHNIYTA